jgi:hypothetical protein
MLTKNDKSNTNININQKHYWHVMNHGMFFISKGNKSRPCDMVCLTTIDLLCFIILCIEFIFIIKKWCLHIWSMHTYLSKYDKAHANSKVRKSF